jgi:hypothetical protein
MSELIEIAGGEVGDAGDWPLVLKSGERIVLAMQGAGLFEPRRLPGHWDGRSAGVSVPVVDGIRVRFGKSAGTYVQGDETPTVIDQGDASITTQRIVFQGGKYTREWDYSKLIGLMHYVGHPMTAIQVSNRQKTSGLVYPGANLEVIRLRFTVALAIYHGEAEDIGQQLREELVKMDAPESSPEVTGGQSKPNGSPSPTPVSEEPRPPVPESTRGPTAAASAPTLPPPMWARDPTGRHQSRYWDGNRWTEYVADNGQQTQDPLNARR